jgi:hypothetical protein
MKDMRLYLRPGIGQRAPPSGTEGLTLTHILLGKLKIIGRDTDQCSRI